jgi:hypothetical protein
LSGNCGAFITAIGWVLGTWIMNQILDGAWAAGHLGPSRNVILAKHQETIVSPFSRYQAKAVVNI